MLKKLKANSLKAAAQDNLADSLVSIGAFIGILGSRFGLAWLDTITAIVVGLIIIKKAIGIFKESVLELTDGFKVEELDETKKTIKDNRN
ncbi:cation transporter [Alkalihalobacillus deserti]|uniref:cation transporter n=1 Tax=Alkalihalobacillus deserti TaxID=2879466 RepID=UPI001D14EF84|nr:cation transporter [Alkalihalobacillus deserti]